MIRDEPFRRERFEMLTGCCKPTPHYLPPFVSKVEASSSWHLPDLDRSSEVLYRRGGRNKRYAVARIDWCEAVLPPAIVSTKQLGIVWCALAFDPAICTCGTCRIPTVGPPFYQTLAMGVELPPTHLSLALHRVLCSRLYHRLLVPQMVHFSPWNGGGTETKSCGDTPPNMSRCCAGSPLLG